MNQNTQIIAVFYLLYSLSSLFDKNINMYIKTNMMKYLKIKNLPQVVTTLVGAKKASIATLLPAL